MMGGLVPLLVLAGAHALDGVTSLKKALKQQAVFHGRRLVLDDDDVAISTCSAEASAYFSCAADDDDGDDDDGDDDDGNAGGYLSIAL